MPGTAKVGMTKANNGFIIILVPGAVFIHIGVVFAVQFVTGSIRFGAQLHHPKRHRSARVHMPHALRTDNGPNVLNKVFC